jgi:hypothetical protein
MGLGKIVSVPLGHPRPVSRAVPRTTSPAFWKRACKQLTHLALISAAFNLDRPLAGRAD